jgi:phage major head subunit gpT-like protein
VSKSDWANILQYNPNISQCVAMMFNFKFNGLGIKIFQNTTINDFTFNAQLSNLRSRLGERVINELPKFNFVNDNNKYVKTPPINSQNFDESYIILIMAPLIVATSISGMDTGLWHVKGDNFRRKIKYIENLPKIENWYENSIIYYLN